MSAFKVGDTVRYKGIDVEITHLRSDNYARIEWMDAFREWHQDFDHIDNFDPIPESLTRAQNPNLTRLRAAYERAIAKDARAAELTAAHRYEDAENHEKMHAASAIDFVRAFKALADEMDVWAMLGGGK